MNLTARSTVLRVLLLCALLLFTSNAYALMITPETMPQLTGAETGFVGNPNTILGGLSSTLGDAVLLYKAEEGTPVTEEGSLVNSYQTTFFNTPNDLMDADIVYTGGDFIGQPAYLFVKDGNNSPFWYLFYLEGWNGIETLELRGFWPGNGAISHVALLGTQQVPEPATLLLLGAGLLGIVSVGRRKFK